MEHYTPKPLQDTEVVWQRLSSARHLQGPAAAATIPAVNGMEEAVMTTGLPGTVTHLQLGGLWSQLSLSQGFHLSECWLFVPPFLLRGWNWPSASFLWPFCAGNCTELLSSSVAQSQAPCYSSLTPSFQVPLCTLLVPIAGGGALSHSPAVVSPLLSAPPPQSGQLSIVAALQRTS